MWILTVRSPQNSPVEYVIKPGKNTLGRKSDNDIVIYDESASRVHAEIDCQNDLAILYDLKSTNGTFVNREIIAKPHVLQAGDQIRIGQHIINVAFQEKDDSPMLTAARLGTRKLTRELLLESIDQNAVFLDAVASRLTTILDLDTALQEVANLTKMAVGADHCGAILADQFHQLDSLELPGFIGRQALDQLSVVIIPNLATRPEQPTGASERPIYSVLCIPVIVEQEVAALLYAYKTNPAARPFDQYDVRLAVAISHQAALTIQRTKLIEKSQMFEQLAITDGLTGLYNHRHILHLADLEFQRARRFHHPFTLLILDLDDFKRINDVYGHLVGDQALRAVAQDGKKQLREVDSFGRYGGDEFVILLAETDLIGGCKVAKRVHQSISEISIETQLGFLNLSSSIGVATISEKTSNLADLLNQADIALLRAKKAGKRRVEVAS